MPISRFFRSRFFKKFYFLFILSAFFIYLVLYTFNVATYDPSSLQIEKSNIKCVTQICVNYVGITECLDIVQPYIFKIDFNENFTVDKTQSSYSVFFESLGKKCAEN